MTKKEMFVEIRNAVAGNAEMVTFIDHEIELLDRKANSPRKPSKVQIENEALKASIVEFLSASDGTKSIKEIQSGVEALAELSNQKITHLLTDLVKAGTLSKEYVKKTPYYSIQ